MSFKKSSKGPKVKNLFWLLFGLFLVGFPMLAFADHGKITEVWREPVSGIYFAYKQDGVVFSHPGLEYVLENLPRDVVVMPVDWSVDSPEFVFWLRVQRVEM